MHESKLLLVASIQSMLFKRSGYDRLLARRIQNMDRIVCWQLLWVKLSRLDADTIFLVIASLKFGTIHFVLALQFLLIRTKDSVTITSNLYIGTNVNGDFVAVRLKCNSRSLFEWKVFGKQVQNISHSKIRLNLQVILQ